MSKKHIEEPQIHGCFYRATPTISSSSSMKHNRKPELSNSRSAEGRFTDGGRAYDPSLLGPCSATRPTSAASTNDVRLSIGCNQTRIPFALLCTMVFGMQTEAAETTLGGCRSCVSTGRGEPQTKKHGPHQRKIHAVLRINKTDVSKRSHCWKDRFQMLGS